MKTTNEKTIKAKCDCGWVGLNSNYQHHVEKEHSDLFELSLEELKKRIDARKVKNEQ